MAEQKEIIFVKKVTELIYEIRGERVILDSDLAELYGTSTKRLNEQVKRNIERFPSDFLFILTKQELINLRSQFATSSSSYGGRRVLPFVFTEHGAIMAATVINTKTAIEMSVHVVRAFVYIRRILIEHNDLTRDLENLKIQLASKFDQYDAQFLHILDTIDRLIEPFEERKNKRIGF